MSSPAFKPSPEGWGFIAPRSGKAHWFRKGKSLCGRWATLGRADLDFDLHSVINKVEPYAMECPACYAKLCKERANGGAP